MIPSGANIASHLTPITTAADYRWKIAENSTCDVNPNAEVEAEVDEVKMWRANRLDENSIRKIEATYLNYVSGGIDAVRRRICRNVRQCVRRDLPSRGRSPVRKRAGPSTFFRADYGALPRPTVKPETSECGNVAALRRLWGILCASPEITDTHWA